MDEILRSIPEVGTMCNMIQTIRERDDVRIGLKRAMCYLELHMAHETDHTWMDPRCVAELGPRDTRLVFDVMTTCTDDFVAGRITYDVYVECADRIVRYFLNGGPRTPTHHTACKIIESHRSGALRAFDMEFVKRVLIHSTSVTS